MNEQLLILPSERPPDTVLVRLECGFRPVAEKPRSRVQQYFDTFDWRLYRSGLVLVLEDEGYRLEKHGTGVALARQVFRRRRPVRFAAELPPGKLSRELARVVSVRALLHLVTVHRHQKPWRLLNADAKTVARVCLEKAALEREGGSEPFLSGITVGSLRGYEAEAARVEELVRAAGGAALAPSVLDAALAYAGITPAGYSSRIFVELAPDQSARSAVTRVLQAQLRVIRANEAGIDRDIDPEFLHDFRVAIRRTRSALSTLGGVYPPEALARFPQEFKDLGRVTGPVRDLDVYLLRRHEYAELLPPQLQGGLGDLFASVERRRQRAHAELVAALADRSYRDLIRRWARFLSPRAQRALGETPLAGISARELADRAVLKRWRRMLKRGAAIADAAPDIERHRLRIDGKKLRYLLEFFATLYPPDPLAALVKQLKKLQDNLGDSNDLSLQLDDLSGMLTGNGDARPSLESAAALGGLIAQLHRRKLTVRRRFAAIFADFASDRTNTLFRDLGAGGGES
jgi:CHAD domain-containing protein